MKRLSLVVLAGWLAISASGCGRAKASATGGASPGSAAGEKKAVKWEEVKSEDGSFTIAFPGKPIVQYVENATGKQMMAGADLPEGVHYSIIMNQINKKQKGPEPKVRLKTLLSQAGGYYGAGAEVYSRTENLNVEGNYAVEYTVGFTNRGKKLKLRCRAFYAHDCRQMIEMMAAGPEGAPDAQQFFDSFKLGTYSDGKEQPKKAPSPTKTATKTPTSH